ncbi:MAG: MAE_28990/MAE_18760 family HEPN-like nuclease [Magnetococcus sp. DMHC-1]
MNKWHDDIFDNLEWRINELTELKAIVISSNTGPVRREVILRSLILMLYAHFEGFCKFLWDYYLDYIEKQHLPRSMLQDSLACLSLSKYFSILKKDSSLEKIFDLSSNFPGAMNDAAIFESKLETASNLKIRIFRENIKKINILVPIAEDRCKTVDALVHMRNEIAHGKKGFIKDIDEYKVYERAVVLVMDSLAIEIMDALEEKKFIKQSP